jgi:hypothetical protein
MQQDQLESDELHLSHQAAKERAYLWSQRAVTAKQEGRAADAARCKDKARDWTSRVLHIERRQRSR